MDWNKLSELAALLQTPGRGLGTAAEQELRTLNYALNELQEKKDWEGIIRMREMFDELVTGESTGGIPTVERLNQVAIEAATVINQKLKLARFLHNEGHNQHRRGDHKIAIDALERSSGLYQELGEDFKSIESYYLTALCYRALQDRLKANEVLESVLARIASDNPWRANPLQTMSWLAQDQGDLVKAEQLLTEALSLYEQYQGPTSVFVVQTLADLGEVVGLQGRVHEAELLFRRSITLANRFTGLYDRQNARTLLKHAEMLMRLKKHEEALQLLDKADDKVRGKGHYFDLLWRIELTRAMIYLRKGAVTKAARKIRSTILLRREIGLSNFSLLKQLITRFIKRAGLPR